MTAFQTIALLLSFAAAGAYVNQRFFGLPGTIGLMLFALLLSCATIGLHRLGAVDLGAAAAFIAQLNFGSIMLHGLLSFLLFAGALHIDLGDLKKHRVVVMVLATAGVGISTAITGGLVWLGAGWLGQPLPLIEALLFGALIAPTDPVAVMGILKTAGTSPALRVKIGCESLFNDGVGVVLFLILLSLAGQTNVPLTASDILLLLVWQGVGAVVLGMTLGWLIYQLLVTVDDYKVEVLLTLALAAGGYALAEAVHVSAPIAVVVAGLVIGNHGRAFGMSDHTRRHLDMFWELLDEILNAILFLLMGLEIIVISFSSLYLALGLMAIAATLLGRFVSVGGTITLLGLRQPFERGTIRLLTWGGLRGGISIALALSLPAGPYKDLIISLTYIVVVFSVLFQGTSFRHLARVLAKN